MSNLLIKWFLNSYGKESIDLNTYGKSTGHSGSYSTNYQQTGRELLMADEIRMLDNDKAILLIRGEKPVIDYKYDILKHPNVQYTVDGKGKVYEYGKVDKNSGIITELTFEEIQKIKDIKYTEEIDENIDFKIIYEENIKKYKNIEELENEKNKKDNE